MLLLTSSAEGPISDVCPCPSTMRSSSWDVPERDKPKGQDSIWNYPINISCQQEHSDHGSKCRIDPWPLLATHILPSQTAGLQRRSWQSLTASPLNHSQEPPHQLRGGHRSQIRTFYFLLISRQNKMHRWAPIFRKEVSLTLCATGGRSKSQHH